MAQLRRKDRALDNESTLQVLENGLYGMLATCGADGPYAVPVNYVFSGGCIYFHCARAGEKLDNLAFDNRACFTVVSDASLRYDDLACNYRSAMAFGTVEEVTEQSEILSALRLLCIKYYGACDTSLENGLVVSQTPAHTDRTALSAVRVMRLCCTKITGKGRLEAQE